MIGEIYIVSSKRTKKTQAEVEQRFLSGLCLERNKDGEFCCGKAGTHRGRCHTSYQRFRMLKLGLGSKKKQAEFDAAAIANGEILAVGEGSEIKGDSLKRIAVEIGAS
jgi:hypothetical protein